MKTLWWLPRIFAGIGLLMLALSLWLYSKEQAFVTNAVRAPGTVVELRYERDSDGGGVYYPYVAFTDNRGTSHTVRSKVGSKPAAYDQGEAVEVLYDPADPEDARISGYFQLHLGSFITSIFAVVWGLIGGIWLYLQRRARALAEELRMSGQRIQAKVVEIQHRTNIRVGSRSPWRIVAQGQDAASGEVVMYTSANIWFNPAEYVGETVTVFVDRNDPSRHVVDLDFLPKLRA